jgi:predicted DsbA family dithiol-disulfide isomerase
MVIDIFSDVICPWCYIGKRRLEQALAIRPIPDVVVRWRAFQLNPEMPEEGMERAAYIAAKFGPDGADQVYERVRAAGAEVGIAFNFAAIKRTPNTLLAHRLLRYAREKGNEGSLAERLFVGYFLEGLNIGEAEILAQLAGECGLDGNGVKAFLASAAEREEVKAEDDFARQIGIHGVPCFVFAGRVAVSGAQPPDVLLRAIAEAEARVAAAAAGTPAP